MSGCIRWVTWILLEIAGSFGILAAAIIGIGYTPLFTGMEIRWE